ncbi:MAG: hypothetical protein ABIG44_19055 [Planctomycetota bacterium]
MPFQPFADKLADCRVVNIPPDLSAEERARFVARMAHAVQQQMHLARHCAGVLRVSGEVHEEGNQLIIPHEPALPVNPQAAVQADERPDINTLWWLTSTLGQALQTAAAEKFLHGGIQLGTLFLDETGRVKLGDFGIAPVYERVCGVEARRYLHCDSGVQPADHGRTASGIWTLLNEDEAREFGWIVVYFAHELLESESHLNLKATPFSLGVLLHIIATGEHPYGAALSDPSLNLYFHLDPYPLEEERPDWAEAFERQRTGLARSADQPIIAWSELLTRYLASDPAQRLVVPEETANLLKANTNAAWVDASDAIDQANKLLDNGDVEGCLDKLKPWGDNEQLPELWRTQLAPWTARVEEQQDDIRARKIRERRVATSQEAFAALDLDKARQAAREVIDDPEAEEDVLSAATELIELCDEQERFVASGADALAVAYLDSARESVAKGALDEAREVLQGLLQDPALSAARKSQAQQLLGEVEQITERKEQQKAEYHAAVQDEKRAAYDFAEERLAALLAEPDLDEELAQPAKVLLESVRTKLANRAVYSTFLDQAEADWQRADLSKLKRRLSMIPADVSDPQIKPRLTRLTQCRDRLNNILQQQRRAEQLLDAVKPAEAAVVAEQAAASEDLPEPLQATLRALVERCKEAQEQQRQAALEMARTVLTKAREAYDGGDTTGCRRMLEDAALQAPGLPADIAQEAERLAQVCQALETATRQLAEARQHLAGEHFDAADGVLKGIASDGLPPDFIQQVSKTQSAVATARQEHLARQHKHLEKQLNEAATALQADQIKPARAAVREVESSPFLNDELRRRAAELKANIRERRKAKRKRAPLIAVVVFVVAVSAGGWYLFSRPGTTEPERPDAPPSTSTVIKPEQSDSTTDVVTDDSVPDSTVVDATPVETAPTASDIPPPSETVVTADPEPTPIVEATPPPDDQPVTVEPVEVDEPPPPEIIEPPPPDPAEQLPQLLVRLQDQVDQYAEVELQAGRAPAQYILRCEPADQLPARLSARDPSTNTIIELGEITGDEIEKVTFKEEWRQRLFPPPPTYDQVSDAFLVELGALLPPTCDPPALQGDTETGLKIILSCDEHELFPFPDLTFDKQRGVLSPTPNEVLAWFRPQIGVWRMLDTPERIGIRLHDDYHERLQIVRPSASRLLAIRDKPRQADVFVHARLSKDPRAEADFELTGGLVADVLTADDAGRAAFDAYLKALQQEQVKSLTIRTAQELALPKVLHVATRSPFESGDVCSLIITYNAQPRDIAQISARWDPDSLEYNADLSDARQQIAAGVNSIIKSLSLADNLKTEWPSLRGQLIPRAPQPGATYYQGFHLLECTPQPVTPDDPCLVPVQATVGPPTGMPDERFIINLPARLTKAGLVWDQTDLDGPRAELAAALSNLATNPEFKQRRQREAIEQLTRESGQTPEKYPAKVTGNELSAEATHEGPGVRYVWTWDPASLSYANRHRSAPAAPVAPAGLDDQLSTLAATPSPNLADFVQTLQAVTARKASSYGAAGYSSGPELSAGGSPSDTLVRLSQALQALTAPDPRQDAFPTIFVEHYAGQRDVYALSWQAVTDGQDRITGITNARVWRVMSTSELRAANEPAAFGSRYSTDADLGERLLGRAMGMTSTPVAASGGGSFGVIVAPHEQLWLTRWEQVRLSPRKITGLDLRGAPEVDEFNYLRQLLAPRTSRLGKTSWRRVGVWCVPTLGGVWHGDLGSAQLALGALIAGKNPLSLSFRPRGADNLVFAYIEDPTRTGDFGWGEYIRTVHHNEIGYTFWNRGWDDRGWLPTPYTSFSLIRALP